MQKNATKHDRSITKHITLHKFIPKCRVLVSYYFLERQILRLYFDTTFKLAKIWPTLETEIFYLISDKDFGATFVQSNVIAETIPSRNTNI